MWVVLKRILKANGLLIQWGVLPSGRVDTRVDIISYSSSSEYAVVLGGQSDGTAYHHDKRNNYFYANIQNHTNEIDWLTIGY